MYRQVFVPNEQNAIHAEWIGREIVVTAYPLTTSQSAETKQHSWLSGNSMIDSHVHIGKKNRKISREVLYDR